MMIKNNKIFLLPDRLAHYREPVFIELAKKLKKYSKDLFLFYDPKDHKVTNVLMPNIERLKIFYKIKYLRNLYFGKTGRGGKVVIFQFGIIFNYLLIRPKVLIAWGEAHRVSTILLLILSKLFRSRVILWTHGFYGNENFSKKIVRILFYGLADKLLIYGQHGYSLTKKLLPNKKIYLIGNSIALDKTKFKFKDNKSYFQHKLSIVKKYGIEKYQDNLIVLSFIGRLTKSKRIDLLIKLLSRSDANNFFLWVIGIGDEYETLIKYAKKLNLLNRIKFFGEIYDQNEIKSILSASDIFICPSNLGLSVCNALSSGIPVITNEKMEMQMPESECLIGTEFAEYVDFEDEKLLIDKINIIYNKFNSNFQLKYKIVEHYNKNFDPKKHALRIWHAIHDIVL